MAPDPFAALDVAGAPRSLVALGGTLDAATLVAAYRRGLFPWPSDDPGHERQARRLVRTGRVPRLPGDDGLVPWCSPDPRAVLLADQVVVRRSLRARLRSCGWTTTLDTAFDAVVAGCADRQEGTWITDRMRQAYGDLHAAGGAHSVEVWDGKELVGGLYGVLVGSVFCGESMFHRATDASKAALVELCARLLEAGVRVVDVQEETEHLRSLGQVLVHRADYLDVLATLRDRPAVLATERRPVARLAEAVT
ncbi:MAG: leucyl/phenylalanyl-tRNA/protein transferase [Frankiales bacterium]|nr:leucyl/phenylalanyl-tRNA/protein transferase [Frankiales bacterium]